MSVYSSVPASDTCLGGELRISSIWRGCGAAHCGRLAWLRQGAL